jgi:hypothetical protein
MAGNLDLARSHHLLALENGVATNDVFAIALGLEGLGGTLLAAGEAKRGVELLGAGLAARDRAGIPLPSGERLDVDRAMKEAGLDADALTKAQAAGAELELEAAIAAAKSYTL